MWLSKHSSFSAAHHGMLGRGNNVCAFAIARASWMNGEARWVETWWNYLGEYCMACVLRGFLFWPKPPVALVSTHFVNSVKGWPRR